MPQIDNPDSIAQTLGGRVKALEDRLDQLSAAQLGKVTFATAYNSPVLTPVITPTASVMTTTVTVPALATGCSYSAFAAGGGLNTTPSAGYMTVQIDILYGTYHGGAWQSQSNIAAGAEGNVTIPAVDSFTFPPGGGAITVKASILNGAGSWTNTAYNSIFAEGLFVFQY